ncbi:MAG: hypothetical protein R3F34_10570 [Planctomycetota bacterium]
MLRPLLLACTVGTSVLFVGCTCTCAGTDPGAVASEESTASVPSGHMVVGVTSDGRELETYEARLVEEASTLVPFVEEFCGRAFTEDLAIFFPTWDEWTAILDEDYEGARDVSLMYDLVWSWYDPAEARVVVSPNYVFNFDGDGPFTHADEAYLADGRHFAVGAFVPSITNALDERTLGLMSRMESAPDKRTKSSLMTLTTGHGVLAQDAWCVAHGFPDVFESWHGRNRSSREYVGRNYLRRLQLAGGREAVEAALVGEPPTPIEIRRGNARNPDLE